jgi:hypothetical protein
MTTLSSLSVHLGVLAALLVLQKDHLDAVARRPVIGDDGSIAVLSRPRG